MQQQSVTWKLFLACVGILGIVGLNACSEPSTPEARATARFANCTPCHGDAGGGKPELGAPAIAGLPAWYVEAQLGKFRGGLRGAHPDDTAGMRMRPMSLTIPTDADVPRIAAHVASLPVQASLHGLEGGDASRGQVAFALCSACHMADGSGMEALKAPPIAGQADWYLFAQLQKYKAGIRGANPDDVSGGQMRAISMSIVDEQAMKDLAAYASSLPRK